MDEEIIDPIKELKDKRGQTLKTISILSWIWMAFSVSLLIFSVPGGPKTVEELDADKSELIASYTDEMMEVMGSLLDDSLEIMQIANDNFYPLAFTSVIALLVGFLGVLWMYKLKKKGYLLYVIYSLAPIISIVLLYRDTYLLVWGTGLHLIVGGLFCVLYGVQLKRMT